MKNGKNESKNDMLLFSLNASFAHQALGVLTLAAYINTNLNSQVCSVLECNINERDDEIFYRLYQNAKDKKIAGFSCYIWNIEKMLKFAGSLKKLLPEIYIVFGGPEVSFYDKANFYSLYPFVDFLIQGEGEEQLLALWESLGEPPRQAHACHPSTGGELIKRRRSDEIPLRGGVPSPSETRSPTAGWSFSGLYKNAENYHTVYYESARGCPFRCSYCISGIDNEKVRAKSVDLIMDELKIIEDKYYNCDNSKINIIKFCDRTFNFDIKRANELYKNLIERAEKYQKTYNKNLLPYQFELYPALFDEDSFDILKTAPKDLFHFEIGVQSLNQKTLEEIGRKNFNINQALENIARIKNPGNIPVHADLIAGLPYEDLESFINGFNLLYEKTKADFIQIGFLKLLRGTRIRKEAGVHGYIYEENPPYTVLCNKYMSFEDMAFLRDTEKMYKRYFSEAYIKSLNYIHNINSFAGNVFEILRILAVHWRKNNLFDKLVSQKDAFGAFYKAFEKTKILNENELVCLTELLENDFYEHDGKKLILKLK